MALGFTSFATQGQEKAILANSAITAQIASDAGYTSLGRIFKRWTMTRLEGGGTLAGVDVIKGKFFAENVSEQRGTEYSEVGAAGTTSPVQQYVRVRGDTLSATLMFVAESMLIDDYESDLNKLASWCLPLSELGRPPILCFTQSATTFVGFLESVSKKREHPMVDGRWLITTVDIQMKEADPADDRYGDIVIDPTKPPHRSRYKPMFSGGTYENLAEREYGSGLYGVLIRQDSFDAFPSAGQLVLLPDKGNYTHRRLAPDAFMLSQHPDAVSVRDELFASRGGTVRVPGG